MTAKNRDRRGRFSAAVARERWQRAIALRRNLHQHPELRFEELRTADLLAENLREWGYVIKRGVARTGIVATLEGANAKPHIALRAEMDAVPISDGKQVQYKSRFPGAAHACGHDVHMAIALMVAETAAEVGVDGLFTLVLQPAEETPFGQQSGAQAMIDEGVLEGLTPMEAILALHCWPALPVGVIGVDTHFAMATKDAFQVVVRGDSTHAAMPSAGCDAVLAISQVVIALHHLVSREVDPEQQAVLNIGTISGGETQSVVADLAEITGAIRTTDPTVRDRLRARIDAVVLGIAEATGTAAELSWADEIPAVRNDERLVKRAHKVLGRVLGQDSVQSGTITPMTSDDFALFAERVPGLYLKLGVCGTSFPCFPLHSRRFDVDEEAIYVGATAMWALIDDLMGDPLAAEIRAQGDDGTLR